MLNSTDAYLPNLPQLTWVQTIRDPVWGEIPITAVEKKIIQTEAFARLRGIKQLSFAYLSYPGALHSRFEHSLGVMHATDMLLKLVKPKPWGGILLTASGRQLLRLAALLHDVGHPPFSHAMENLFTYYPDLLEKVVFPENRQWNELRTFLEQRSLKITDLARHDIFTEFIICYNPGIYTILKNWVIETFLSDLPPEPKGALDNLAQQLVQNGPAKLATGKSPEHEKVPRSIRALIPVFKSIVSGDIDADKIDYLIRDNYYCGLPHGLDLASLRGRLVPGEDGLAIEPEAISLVQSLLLARYRLITQVHHEEWNVFATARTIRILHDLLLKEESRLEKIITVFTKWDDSALLSYINEAHDDVMNQVLTTQYPLRELARLDFIETHPSIRECVQLLSESANHHHIPEFEEDLRKLVKIKDLVIHVRSVRSPDFSMKIGTENLLRDQIVRGISEESIKNLCLIVYGGSDDFRISRTIFLENTDLLPCQRCGSGWRGKCIGNLAYDLKKQLLAQLAVRRYRMIAHECGGSKILAVDFLLLIMEKIEEICVNPEKEADHPIRQDIYRIAQMIYASVKKSLGILDGVDLSQNEITSSFYQELRKYEELGLIGYSREMHKLPNENDPSHMAFRYDRRFGLSAFGRQRLEKVRWIVDGGSGEKEYGCYVKAWATVQDALTRNAGIIEKILREGSSKPDN